MRIVVQSQNTFLQIKKKKSYKLQIKRPLIPIID